jgi:hypothetical protein
VGGDAAMSATKEQFTERQARGWLEAIADLHSRGIEASDNPDGFYWTLVFAEETRPGRGHDLDAHWIDGEHFVQLLVDVYGSWRVSIAELDWLHASSDEDCGCDRCVAERTDDEVAS